MYYLFGSSRHFYSRQASRSQEMAVDQQAGRQQKPATGILRDVLLLGPRLLFSRFAFRAYITTILFTIAAVALAAASIVIYLFFYNLYIPQPGFVKPIYLQFEPGHHPWGTVSLDSSAGPTLAALVKYDVEVTMHLPRSPVNKAAGNFMLELRLNEMPDPAPRAFGNLTASSSIHSYELMRTLAISRRPAMLKYRSRLVENAKRMTALAFYVVGWKEEAETVVLSMMEGVEFGRWRTPKSMRLEVQSAERMQIYWMKVAFEAKLGGLRYIMHKYRVASFFVFTSMFWTISMTFAITMWLLSAFLLRRRAENQSASLVTTKLNTTSNTDQAIKQEPNEDDLDADLSDTSRTFPTSSRQPLLHYSGTMMARIKKEGAGGATPNADADSDDAPPLPPRHLLLSSAAEADVEDEDEDANFTAGRDTGQWGRSDSGLGTSMESSVASGMSVRRRNSKKKGSGGFG